MCEPFLGAHARLALMARGRGQGGQKLAFQGDFAVVDGARSETMEEV